MVVVVVVVVVVVEVVAGLTVLNSKGFILSDSVAMS